MIRSIADVDGQRLACDVCIVGAGAAGLALASELEHSGLKLTLLAGGPEQIAPRAQELYRTLDEGLRLTSAQQMRFRVLGGSTRRWAGQLLPFVEEDFAPREWVAHSGWPVGLAELAPYYTRASRWLGAEPFPEGRRPPWPDDFPSSAPLGGGPLEPYCSVFLARPDLARAQHDALRASAAVDVLLGASLTELHGDGSGVLERARIRGEGGEDATVAASTFVVCAGGLETARILLDTGAAPDERLLGRFFQEHGGISVALAECDMARLVELLALRREHGVARQPYLRASPELQRERRLPGANAAIVFDQPAALVAGKELFRAVRDPSRRRAVPRNALTVLRGPGPLARGAARHLRGASAQDSASVARLALGTEPLPNPESRVALAGERDALGVRRLAVDWRITEGDLAAMRAWLEILAVELERAGLAKVDLASAPALEHPMALSGILVDAGHHMGTTRMAREPHEGVVDPDCRVFGTENLYVASSSVFPTSGTSNPTLTIVALALRLADRLRGAARGR